MAGGGPGRGQVLGAVGGAGCLPGKKAGWALTSPSEGFWVQEGAAALGVTPGEGGIQGELRKMLSGWLCPLTAVLAQGHPHRAGRQRPEDGREPGRVLAPSTHPSRTTHTHPGAASPEHHVPAREAESSGVAPGADGWGGWNPQHRKQGSALAWYLLVSPVPERPAVTKGDTGSLRRCSEQGVGSSSETSVSLKPCGKDFIYTLFVVIKENRRCRGCGEAGPGGTSTPRHRGTAARGSARGAFRRFTPILELF